MNGAPGAAGLPQADARLTWAGLVVLLSLATLGEGGGAASSLLLWHGWLVLLLLWALLVPHAVGPERRGLAFGPLVACVLFLALAWVGAARAPYFYAALLVGIELAACTGLVLLAAAVGPAWLAFAAWPMRLLGALQGLVVVAQWAAFGAERPAGTFLNSNHMAAWIGATLLLGLGELASRASRRAAETVLGVVLAVPAAAALVLSGSRGALAGVAVGLLYLLWRGWSGLSTRQRTLALLVLVGLAGVAAYVLRQRVAVDPFAYHRLDIWKASLSPVAEDPFWGTGPGQFETAAANLRFDDGRGPLRFDRSFNAAHSDLLRVVAELGVPAALALLAGLGLALREIGRRGTARLPGGAGALAALVALGVQALVDNPSRWPSVYLLASVLCGCLLSVPSARTDRPPSALRPALALLLVLLFAVADVGPSIAWFRTAGMPRGRLDEAGRRRLDSALALNPLHPDLWMRRAEDLAGDGAEWDAERYAAAREAAERAVRLQPEDVRYRWARARIEGRACLELFPDVACRERARREFELAQELSRRDPRIGLDAGGFLLAAADPAGAARLAEAALAIEPNAVVARLLLAESLLGERSPAAADRAARLLGEAEHLAAEYGDAASENVYSRELLSLDLERAAAVRDALAHGTGSGASTVAEQAQGDSAARVGSQAVR